MLSFCRKTDECEIDLLQYCKKHKKEGLPAGYIPEVVRFILGNISPGVNVSAVNVDFKVAMRTGAVARASHFGDLFALCDLLTDAHRNS